MVDWKDKPPPVSITRKDRRPRRYKRRREGPTARQIDKWAVRPRETGGELPVPTPERARIPQLLYEILRHMPQIPADTLIMEALHDAARITKSLQMTDKRLADGLAQVLEALVDSGEEGSGQ